ncbi:MAG: hypothetical protein ABIQ16_18540 [Polyangiaceae bacterium]
MASSLARHVPLWGAACIPRLLLGRAEERPVGREPPQRIEVDLYSDVGADPAGGYKYLIFQQS